MPDTRYVFGLLSNGEPVEEIALQGVSMSGKLNAWGTFRGSFGLDQSGKKNIDLTGATIPGLCYVCCERNNVPIWFGIIWSRTYQSNAKVVNFTARSLATYPSKRRITTDLDFNVVDQGTIFLEFWEEMLIGSNLDIVLPSSFVTGVSKSFQTEARNMTVYEDAIGQIANDENGFDWRIDTSKDALGNYIHTLAAGYPTLGNTEPSRLTFEYPGNILNYYQTASMAEASTTLYMTSENTSEDGVFATYVQPDMVSTGLWVQYDHMVARLDVENADLLNGLITTEGPLRRPPMNVVKAFLRAEAEPMFGSYSLGDASRLWLKDALYESGSFFDTRIVSYDYTPQSNDSVETVELIFEGDELNE